MIFLMILILTRVTWSSSAGSSVFYKRYSGNRCWSENDIARLHARQVLEKIVPPHIIPETVNDKYIRHVLRYFRSILQNAAINDDSKTDIGLKELVADTIGSHMRSEILPASRFAFYAGYVAYRNVRELHDFYNNLKIILNTQGLGWRTPEKVPNLGNLTVEKIRIGTGKYINSCASLITKRDSRSCLHLPPPKLDDDHKPTAIALPFRNGGLVNLESGKAENILIKYYTTASRCILRDSPKTCRHSDFVNFNNELWHWMKRDVAPHLVDEKLYSSYGGILRVAAAVQNYGKGLTRRNLFEYQNAGVSKWQPWKALTESYIIVNADWTPYIYVAIVLLIVLAMCLMNVCYSYVFERNNNCHCPGQADHLDIVDVEYAHVESNIPAMLPSPRSDKPIRLQKTNAYPSNSVRTQKVYDMHENIEKIMSVMASESDEEYTIRGISGKETITLLKRSERSSSPPKIETSLTEISIERKESKTEFQSSMTSMSAVSDSEKTCAAENDLWSVTSSSSSAHSTRSVSCKTVSRSRECLTRKRYVSNNTYVGNTSFSTDIAFKSSTTPPSKGT